MTPDIITPDIMDLLLISIAALAAGALNAVAGGGSFLTLPALIAIGVPPIAANATGTAALLPGYFTAYWRSRRDAQLAPGFSWWRLLLIVVTGSAIGAWLLLNSDAAYFERVIPWLILTATVAFMIGPKWVARDAGQANSRMTVSIVLLLVCIYGGYFNGGLGIILLAALSLLGHTHLAGMNGLKNLISLVLTLVAVLFYGGGGAIAWGPCLLMGVAASAGGWIGATLGYRIPVNWLRLGIIVAGLALFIAFL